MKITIDNYEALLIDYMDGTISTQDLESLKIFLLTHPELDIQLQDLQDMPALTASTDTVFDYQYLLKEDQGAELPALDTLMIGHVENVNTHDQEKELKSLLHKHPEKIADLNLYKKTKLPVLYSIFYDNKESLFKEAAVFSMRKILAPLAVAASLLIGVFAVYNYLQEDPTTTVAATESVEKTVPQDTSTSNAHTPIAPSTDQNTAVAQTEPAAPAPVPSTTPTLVKTDAAPVIQKPIRYQTAYTDNKTSSHPISTPTPTVAKPDTAASRVHKQVAAQENMEPTLAVQDAQPNISYQYYANTAKPVAETKTSVESSTKQEKVNTVSKIIAWASNDKVQASATLNDEGKTNYNVHIGNYGVQVSR